MYSSRLPVPAIGDKAHRPSIIIIIIIIIALQHTASWNTHKSR